MKEGINVISVYSTPEKDDLVLLFKAKIKGQVDWQPDDEIQQISFFEKNNLPTQIHPRNIKRINDAYENKTSNLCIFE
ncbi:hypothetical protein [Inconstantimicrobium mannanitabidum]|uniref:Uncharacterized protein n=1 Tax=Inconstantimicrobium mannanitabidum TaxID=1604901 RepID=A0ACB5RBJ5_9CLOT|nr:hypothetical protein [Clostridium sp. TW13]GKX66424.1 hypothetical protein rsdtw13_16820 [Clostridium sp. TW13]